MSYLVKRTDDTIICCQNFEIKDPCTSCYPARKWENCKDYLKMQGKGVLILMLFITVIGAAWTGVMYGLKGNSTDT